MPLTAVAGRTFGDLGAFDRYGHAFQLAGVYLNQKEFYTICPLVSQAFKKTMEGQVAQYFHWSSREREIRYIKSKAPFFYSIRPECVVFSGLSDLPRVFRNSVNNQQENILYTRFSHFSATMPCLNRNDTVAVVLQNDWQDVSKKIENFRASLLEMQKRLRVLQRYTPAGAQFGILAYQQLKKEISELEGTSDDVHSLNRQSLRLMMLQSFEDEKRMRLLHLAEVLVPSIRMDAHREIEELNAHLKQTIQKIKDLKARCERFGEIRLQIPQLTRDKLCFFDDQNNKPFQLHGYILLANDNYPPNHPDYIASEDAEFILPFIQLSEKSQEIIKTRTKLRCMDSECSPQSMRKELDELELSFFDEDLNKSQKKVIAQKVAMHVRQLECTLKRERKNEQYFEGQHRASQEETVRHESFRARRLRLSSSIDAYQREIVAISHLANFCLDQRVKEYLERRQGFLQTQTDLLQEEYAFSPSDIALRQVEGEWVSSRQSMSSMRFKELDRYKDDVSKEVQELKSHLSHTSLHPQIHVYMNARQIVASRELESIQEEITKRMELVEKSKKGVNALSAGVRANQTEIAPIEERILPALSAIAGEEFPQKRLRLSQNLS